MSTNSALIYNTVLLLFKDNLPFDLDTLYISVHISLDYAIYYNVMLMSSHNGNHKDIV